MSRGLERSEQGAILGLVFLLVLAMPVGGALAGALTAPVTATGVTPTPPPILNLTETPTSTDTPTSTETPTPTPTASSGGDGGNGSGESNGSGAGSTLVVDDGSGSVGSVTGEACGNASYMTIQGAVDDASQGDTIRVCGGTYTEHVKVTTANLTIRADGDATIENTGESAVWINASGVTLRGFTVRVVAGAAYAIEVGGHDVLIRNNTVESPGVGIFLSDGHTETGECNMEGFNQECDQSPPVDPELGAATGGGVVNNDVSSDHIRIWVDADQTVVRNNFVIDRQSNGGRAQSSQHQMKPGFSSTTGHEDEPYCQDCERYNSSIVSSAVLNRC